MPCHVSRMTGHLSRLHAAGSVGVGLSAPRYSDLTWSPTCRPGWEHTREVHSGRSPDFLRVFGGTVRSLEWQVRTVRTFLPGKLLHFRSGLWTGKTAESGHSGHFRLTFAPEGRRSSPSTSFAPRVFRGLRRRIRIRSSSR